MLPSKRSLAEAVAMKILVVAEGRSSDFVGGAETVISYLTRALGDRGNEVHTLTRKPQRDLPDYERDGGVHVHRYAGPRVKSRLYWLYPLLSFWEARCRFAHLHRRMHFDAIIFNQPFAALGILSLGRHAGIKKVYIFHSAAHLEFRAAMPWSGTFAQLLLNVPLACVRRVEGYTLRKCEEIVTLSRYMRDSVVDIHGLRSQRVQIIPGGVDTRVFSPVSSLDEKKRLREKLGIPAKSFVLFAAKRMYAGMGLENLIEAVEILSAKELRIRVCLLLAGDGPRRRNLDNLIDARGLGDRIRLLGNVSYHQMPSYYRAADLFISSRAEPFGLVTLEALACGLPVLSVPVGGTVEILEGLSRDLLFENASSAAMAALIKRYINSPKDLTALSARCRAYVENNYTWSITGERMEKLLFEQATTE